jgi:hypothetical protein
MEDKCWVWWDKPVILMKVGSLKIGGLQSMLAWAKAIPVSKTIRL